MQCRRAVSIVLVMALCTLAARTDAHPPENGHRHDDAEHTHDQKAASPAPLPQALILPQLDGVKPWSEKPILNDPSRFHIAIMTDNTGGHRPGIWMKAVERINWMRPEFVVSVGDLIEGYSTNRNEIEEQWKEFLGFIEKMEMKFFFVAGNHDVSNPTMHTIWREHFGTEWYSFDYKGVHFVCMSSEDSEDQIGPEQLAWLEQDLAKNAGARWTLLFMHKPLWTRSEAAVTAGNPDPTNWKNVEKFLGDRPFTVFAGHVHHYVQYERSGRKYYHLATTGGGSQLRGIPYGEFDHVTWLTMEPDGPHVANLLLDGILPADAVTEKGIARFRDFLAKTRIEVAPILISEGEGLTEGKIEIRVTNQFDRPIEVRGTIQGLPMRGLHVDPAKLEISAAPGDATDLGVRIRFAESIAFPHLAETLLTARVRTVGDDPPLSCERTIPVVIDRRFPCPTVTLKSIDGVLEEALLRGESTSEHPLLVGAAETWTGPDDAALQFGLGHDDRFLYLSAHVDDERVIAGDALELRLDARFIDQRRNEPQLGRGSYAFRLSAPDANQQTRLEVTAFRNGKRFDGATAAARRTDKGYDVEIAVPIEFITNIQPADWHSIQATVIVYDQDEKDGQTCAVVWRGTESFASRNTNYGQFATAP
ncbi:MAG: metallophosphoesterase [Pirellulales bacterium]